jgi:hypothetical protein
VCRRCKNTANGALRRTVQGVCVVGARGEGLEETKRAQDKKTRRQEDKKTRRGVKFAVGATKESMYEREGEERASARTSEHCASKKAVSTVGSLAVRRCKCVNA